MNNALMDVKVVWQRSEALIDHFNFCMIPKVKR